MTRRLFFLRGRFWLFVLKIFGLALVSGMILVQIPEMRYGLSSKVPVEVTAPHDLSFEKFPKATFVSIKGKADFEKAFVYKRYGLSYTYFNLEPYGMRLVVRTHLTVDEAWRDLDRFLGKLRPFRYQPFHYRIRDIYRELFDTPVPSNAFFLALDDVPRVNGWQVGAVIFASVLWIAMFYMFFFFKGWKKLTGPPPATPSSSPQGPPASPPATR
jgi:hypothetical protein